VQSLSTAKAWVIEAWVFPSERGRLTSGSSRPRQGAAIQALISIRGVRGEGAAAQPQAVGRVTGTALVHNGITNRADHE